MDSTIRTRLAGPAAAQAIAAIYNRAIEDRIAAFVQILVAGAPASACRDRRAVPGTCPE